MAVYDELEAIRLRAGGILRPADVVEFARNPQTELHSRFEWDDSRAAEEYRLEQARHIIRTTVRVLPGDETPIRAYVSLTRDRVDGDSYRAIEDVLSKQDLRAELIKQALQEAETWRLRYQRFAELRPITRAIEQVQQDQSQHEAQRRAAKTDPPKKRRRRRQ